MREITEIIIHCSDTPSDMDIGAEEIRRWHVDGNGWSDIGYHYVVRRDGSIERGREPETIGAHAKGHNKTSLGVCLVGGRDGKFDFTHQQMAALYRLCVSLTNEYDGARVIGHRDVSGKLCPGFDAIAWWNE